MGLEKPAEIDADRYEDHQPWIDFLKRAAHRVNRQQVLSVRIGDVERIDAISYCRVC